MALFASHSVQYKNADGRIGCSGPRKLAQDQQGQNCPTPSPVEVLVWSHLFCLGKEDQQESGSVKPSQNTRVQTISGLLSGWFVVCLERGVGVLS